MVDKASSSILGSRLPLSVREITNAKIRIKDFIRDYYDWSIKYSPHNPVSDADLLKEKTDAAREDFEKLVARHFVSSKASALEAMSFEWPPKHSPTEEEIVSAA